ncbi:DUF6571 family protein [Streptomyces sp. MMG1121]|uniref:DUF6571 family protein n=1 Tax=Streptomyces sp. MMG1121 TaxID=1415544 RepID=UPI0006ADB1F4|nr:DUF6571 family protein [Streptomyces sp. MMG1121]KOV59873.1 hypothetical protein ADK64_32415 [Streptomyces sp. MMG1121]
MDLDALRHGNFSQLGEAITDWEKMTKDLATLKEDARSHLKSRADKANWAGVNAQVSREFIDKTAEEFADAHAQADSVTKILKDTRGELIGYRSELNETLERPPYKYCTVIDTGHGTFSVTGNPRPDWASDPSGETSAVSQKDVNDLRNEIQRILNKATESDNTAAKALKLLVDQAKYGFSSAHYENRDEAAKAVADADRMAKILAKNPHDVTNTELASLNATLAKYKNDPLFAEEFATQVGPKKVLTFWAGIADPYQGAYDPDRAKQAKQLQKNLGTTIGLATLSDSDRMQSWEKQMIKLGPDQLGIDDASNPTGYAAMSNLMRFGDYDDQFLNSYGDKLLAYDKKVNGEGINLWVNNANQGDLNYWGYKNDRGRDPVTGFLEALGHNPDASTQFFEQPEGAGDTVNKDSEVNDHLKYLTKERVWTADTTLEGKDGYVAGRDSLGHALEAATTGFAYDATENQINTGGEHRTSATAGVMEQVSYLYGSQDGPKMLHNQPELADSLGKIAGAYIDDIDHDLSGVGEYEKDSGTFPAKYGGRANFTQEGAINFLSVLGQDENAHRAVTAAQHLYTLSALDAYPPTSDANIQHAHDALSAGAQARGILDNSRVQQAETTYKEDAEEANKSLGRSAEWIKLGVGTTVGVGIGAIPLPGSTAAAVVIAPIAADTAGEAINTFIGQQIDKGVDGSEQDPTEKSQLTGSAFYKKGENQLGSAYHTYIKDSPKAAEVANDQNWNDDIKSAYLGIGSNENDYRGRAPYKD